MTWTTTGLRGLEGIALGPSEAVYAFVSLAGEPSAADRALLSAEERARSQRFVRPADCRRFVLAHAALRLFLAGCLRVEPATVIYVDGVNGKPRLPASPAPLEFNLSHSGDLGLIAVDRRRAVGVDVELVRDVPDAVSIADTHFSVSERQALRSLPVRERRTAFLRGWTRKEAVIKASGEGLGRALDTVEVDLAPGSTSALRRYAGRSGREAGWMLRDVPCPAGHVAAVAAATVAGDPVRWRELTLGAGSAVVPDEVAGSAARRPVRRSSPTARAPRDMG